MTDQTIFADREAQPLCDARTQTCPACGRPNAGPEVEVASLPESLQRLIAANLSTLVPRLCFRCAELFERAERQLRAHAVVEEQ